VPKFGVPPIYKLLKSRVKGFTKREERKDYIQQSTLSPIKITMTITTSSIILSTVYVKLVVIIGLIGTIF
jgi:hypothetical protein